MISTARDVSRFIKRFVLLCFYQNIKHVILNLHIDITHREVKCQMAHGRRIQFERVFAIKSPKADEVTKSDTVYKVSHPGLNLTASRLLQKISVIFSTWKNVPW